MTDLEVMKRAQMYIEKLANGVDPLTNRQVADNDIINNVRISRCLFYVSDVLKGVIASGGREKEPARKAKEKLDFSLTQQQIASLCAQPQEISATRIASAVNALVDRETMHVLTATAITGWLKEAGFLYDVTNAATGMMRKLPTEQGMAIGISEGEFFDGVTERKYLVYNAEAQQFVFDNIEPIAEFCKREYAQKAALKQIKRDNKDKLWTKQEDEQLCQMYQGGASFKRLSDHFERPQRAVKARLRQLGLLET